MEVFFEELSFFEVDWYFENVFYFADGSEVEIAFLQSFVEVADVLLFEQVLVDDSVGVVPLVGHDFEAGDEYEQLF